MAQQDLNTGTSYDDPTADSVKDSFDKCQANFDDLYSNISLSPIKFAYVEIGTWNMDHSEEKVITHSKPDGAVIISLTAMIRNDMDNVSKLPIDYVDSAVDTIYDGTAGGGISETSTGFIITRKESNIFDSANFDSTSFNRGYIVYSYIIP